MLRIKLLLEVLIFVLALTFISGCSDDNDDPVAPEEHFEAVGMVLLDSGIKVFEYYAPDYPAGSTETNDTLKLGLGLSPHYDVKFYNESKELIDPPADPEMTFGADFSDPAIAKLQWDAGEEGGFEVHINGLTAGLTKAEFQILHAGHADFKTLRIPILVE